MIRVMRFGLLLGVATGFLVSAPGWAGTDPGEKIFESRCNLCHDLPDPNKLSPPEWEKKLEVMGKNANLDPTQKDEVLNYLKAHTKKAATMASMADEKRLFQQKCSLCHSVDRVFREPLTDQSRRHIVLRMQKRAPDWISPEQAQGIMGYLQHLANNPAPEKGSAEARKLEAPAAVFRERCTACHTLERVYLMLEKNSAPQWTHIVNRMRQKAPNWLTEDDADKVLQYLQSLRPVGAGNQKTP